jgi:putative nucleotidyltransferase with HDIG domain
VIHYLVYIIHNIAGRIFPNLQKCCRRINKQTDYETHRMFNMSDLTEIVYTATKPLTVQQVKERTKSARWNVNTVIIAFAVLAVVIFLQFQGIVIEIVGPVAILGLSMIWLISWIQAKRIYKVFYEQELHQLQDLVQLAQEKQDNSTNILGTIHALAATVDAKDHYTYGHSEKVAKYATEIAQELGYSRDNLESVRVAALLHDIGKIGVPDHVLSKPGPLSNKEWEIMRRHPDLGAAILKHIDAFKDCLGGVLHHHERYDGSGYPAGLKGDNIPLNARILAVADAYDAMTSERPYRCGKMTREQALSELRRCAGKQFDPIVVEVFVNLFEEPKLEEMKSKQNPAIAIDQSDVALVH